MATANFSGIRDDITQCIGNTPLVKIRRISEGCVATVAGKVENMKSVVERQRPYRSCDGRCDGESRTH